MNVHSKHFSLEKDLAIQKKIQTRFYKQKLLLPAIEDRFFKLVKAGEKYGFDIDAIMEKPDFVGSTVFETASILSVKICKFILDRKIRVNNILVNFIYPSFWLTLFDDAILEKMLKKGINPKIIPGTDFKVVWRNMNF